MSAIILDKRTIKSRAAPNRKAFIDRYRDVIKGHVDRLAAGKGRSITDISQKKTITIKKKDIQEPEFEYDKDSGQHDYVLSGNEQYVNGDLIPIPKQQKGAGGGGDGSGESEDEFTFTLTKEEFLDIYFADLELPDLLKESIKKIQLLEYKRAGYCKEGSPCQLDIKKTFENSIARKIATRDSMSEPPPFLDEMDLRYKFFKQEPRPSKDAVMFCLLDVSGSVNEEMKLWAKKFFILLYLFLEKAYKDVEVIFIRHHDSAKEVEEQNFFYDKDSGGTVMSTAYELVDSIIKDRYSSGSTNIYISQASDGENAYYDNDHAENVLVGSLIPQIQYLAYIELVPSRLYYNRDAPTWRNIIDERVTPSYPNVQARKVGSENEILDALFDLFKKRT